MTQTQTANPTQADPGQSPRGQSGLVPYRLTVRQFEKMIITGILGDEDRVELLAGLLIKKMTTYDPHDFAVMELGDKLRDLLRTAWVIREGKSVVLGRFWRPQPDIVVVRGPSTRYRSKAPRPRDLGLLVEVGEVCGMRRPCVLDRQHPRATGRGLYVAFGTGQVGGVSRCCNLWA